MPTRNINLTAEQDDFIEEAVRKGRYQNASEAMRDAVRALQFRIQAEELKLGILRNQLQQAVAALAQGDFTELDDSQIEGWLDRISADGEN